MFELAPPSSRPAAGQPMQLLELLLRLCAAEDPRPWHPRAYARSAGVPQEMLYYGLENLFLDGLVRKAESAPEDGPGVLLTPLGREVLDDPAALQRLREGRPVVEGDRGGIVREAIRRPPRPTVTYGLLAVNLAVFTYGLLLAVTGGVGAANYLMPGRGGFPLALYEKLGALIQGDALVRGEWWRLATSCFVHFGIFHVVFAVYALYRVGARVEQLWGAWRVCLLYLLAGIGGNCVGVGLQPTFVMPGAWGAIYGLLGATAVWVVCNDRCLPRAVARRMRTNVALDAFLLLLYFVIYPIDRWQDLGGTLTGAAVALVFQAQRFGPSPWRWAALAALVPLPWAGVAFINHERATNPEWAQLNNTDEKDRQAFQDAFLKRIQEETRDAFKAFTSQGGVLDQAPGDRLPADVDRVKGLLAEKRAGIKQLADDLDAAGPYKDEPAENARQTGLQFVLALNDLLVTAEKRLREGTEWTPDDQALIQKVKDAADAWHKLLR